MDKLQYYCRQAIPYYDGYFYFISLPEGVYRKSFNFKYTLFSSSLTDIYIIHQNIFFCEIMVYVYY